MISQECEKVQEVYFRNSLQETEDGVLCVQMRQSLENMG